MITIESAESALKNIYLDIVVNDINTKTNPFLTMIGKNTKNVTGKEIKCPIRYGDGGNVAAASETGDLPVSTSSKYAEISVPLKNIYGTFQISDKAIRASQGNAGAFANLLSGEMQNLVATAQSNLNQMIYGNGMQVVAYTSVVNFGTKFFRVPLRFAENISAGDDIDLYSHNNEKITPYGPLKVVTFDKATGEGTFTGSPASPRYERFYIVKASAETDVNINGIDSLFLQTGKIYNISTDVHKGINLICWMRLLRR